MPIKNIEKREENKFLKTIPRARLKAHEFAENLNEFTDSRKREC